MNEMSAIFSGLAIVVALVSIWLTRRSWLQTYRPIVSAYIETRGGAEGTIKYDIVVLNSGNRPAKEIRLQADEKMVRSCFGEAQPEGVISAILNCFKPEGQISLLANGTSTRSSFGYTTGNEASSVWKYDSKIPIVILYKDLTGRKFKAKLDIMIRDTQTFSGGSWG
jgi:hypothetical protein